MKINTTTTTTTTGDDEKVYLEYYCIIIIIIYLLFFSFMNIISTGLFPSPLPPLSTPLSVNSLYMFCI